MKIKFLFFSLLLSGATFSQLSFEANGKYLFNSTWLINKNISDQGAEQDYDMAWSSNYGAGFTIYFGSVGLGVEGLFGNFKGAYAGEIKSLVGTYKYTSNVDLNLSQIPIFLKFKGDKGGFIELGAQMNSISKATYTMEGDVLAVSTLYNPFLSNPADVSSKYSKSYLSAIMGFGANIKPKNFPLGILIGARLQYGFQDAKGVDAFGRDVNGSSYQTQERTMPISGGMYAGITYTISTKKDKRDNSKK